MEREQEMSHESLKQTLERLLTQWDAGNITEEEKEFVITQVPVMRYVNEHHQKVRY